MDAVSKEIRVAIPGIVQKWNAEEQTVEVECAIKEKIYQDGSLVEVKIPLLVDLPIVFPTAGGYSFLAVPKKGDECLVVFADMCIDGWYQSGGVQSQMDRRRHDLSDGFAIMGCWSQPNVKKKFPKEGCVLQNDNGTAGVSIKNGTLHVFGSASEECLLTNDAGSAGVSVKGGVVNIFGSVHINGRLYDSHQHSGVWSGGSNTGGVV